MSRVTGVSKHHHVRSPGQDDIVDRNEAAHPYDKVIVAVGDHQVPGPAVGRPSEFHTVPSLLHQMTCVLGPPECDAKGGASLITV